MFHRFVPNPRERSEYVLPAPRKAMGRFYNQMIDFTTRRSILQPAFSGWPRRSILQLGNPMYQLDVFNEFGFRNAPHYVFSGDRLEKNWLWYRSFLFSCCSAASDVTQTSQTLPTQINPGCPTSKTPTSSPICYPSRPLQSQEEAYIWTCVIIVCVCVHHT